jgi:hypothetical protein
MPDRLSFVDRVRDYFLAREGQYCTSTELATVGGREAWRTRISDCRTRYGMTIENRTRVVEGADGSRFTLSEYRYLKAAPSQDPHLDFGQAPERHE